MDTDHSKWRDWNWRSEGDILVNGAFFVASGEGLEVKYEKAYSVEPKSAAYIDLITWHAGVLGVGGRYSTRRSILPIHSLSLCFGSFHIWVLEQIFLLSFTYHNA